jgi:outer membrane protein assembly factor BamB
MPRGTGSEGSEPPNTDQPWSPFPVQDWSTLPPDPLGGVAVNPTWAPPHSHAMQPPRPWWRPLVIIAVVAALIAATTYVANSTVIFGRAAAATQYLPADGAVAYERTDTTRELETSVGTTVTESARMVGVAAILSVDNRFGEAMVQETLDQSGTIKVWRTITTQLNDPAATGQSVRFYRVSAGVELLGVSTPTEGYVYSPGLILLPADVRPGSRWSNAGSAGDLLDYRSELQADAADDGCLKVTGEVRYFSKQAQLGRIVTLEQTWCPGQGVVAESQSFANVRTTTSRIEAPAPSTPTTTNTPISWSVPQRWTGRQFGTVSINPTFGEGPMVGTPANLTPARTESGLIIRATYSQGDLVATTPKTLTDWTSVWRAHPGGSILTLTTFGNVIIATTSNRQVVAYSDVGIRLWQFAVDDLAQIPPVRAGDHEAILVDLTGVMRSFDLTTGAQRWQHNVGSDVNVAPVVGSGVVVIMDRGGTTTAFDVATGKRRWHVDLEGRGATIIGSTVVVLQDQAAHGLALDTGLHRWVRPFFGTLASLTGFATYSVVATKSECIVINDGGVIVKRLGPALALTATHDHLVLWGTAEAQVLDVNGVPVTRWSLPSLTIAEQDRVALASPEGVTLFNSDWTFEVREDVG